MATKLGSSAAIAALYTLPIAVSEKVPSFRDVAKSISLKTE